MDKDELLARELEKLSLKPTAPLFFGHSEPQAILSVKMLLNKLTRWNFYSILQKYDYESLKQFLLESKGHCVKFLSVLFKSIRASPLAVELTTYFLIQILTSPLPKDFITGLISLISSNLQEHLFAPIYSQDEDQKVKLLQYKLSLIRMMTLLECHSLFAPERVFQILKQMVETKLQDFEGGYKFDIILWTVLNLQQHSLLSQNMAQIYKFFLEQTGQLKLSQRQKILVKLPEEVGGIISERNKEAKSILLTLFSMFYELPRPLIQENLVWIKQDTI